MTTGYANAEYAASLSEFGEPRQLPRSDGWILERPIGGTVHRDGMGPYPPFFCRDWSRLADDVTDLAGDLVSIVLVTDPFADVDADTLQGAFDHVVHFKDHYIADLEQPLDSFVSKTHRAKARRALRALVVGVSERPWDRLDDWVRLYATLCHRHSITGLRAFSRHAFEVQLRIPGLVMLEATKDGEVVGLDLWYVQGDVAYGHLVAVGGNLGVGVEAPALSFRHRDRLRHERARKVGVRSSQVCKGKGPRTITASIAVKDILFIQPMGLTTGGHVTPIAPSCARRHRRERNRAIPARGKAQAQNGDLPGQARGDVTGFDAATLMYER